MTRTRAADQDQRDAAIGERRRNVIVDAGAGTGKTTILVDRLVARVAPADDAEAELDVGRLAAVTFTRRAAGELRLRVRERLLGELATGSPSPVRRARLERALGGLDTAHIGTIHGFADRLLRQRPVEADLSPAYEVAEDTDALVEETFALLLARAEAGTLGDLLAGTPAAALASEATLTLGDALHSGLRVEAYVGEWITRAGLSDLIAGFVLHRDAPPELPPLVPFDQRTFRAVAGRVASLCAPLRGDARGIVWLRRLGERLAGIMTLEDPVEIFAEVTALLARGGPPATARKFDELGDDDAAWDVWKQWIGKPGPRAPTRVAGPGLKLDLIAPLHHWMAIRLCRVHPVAVAVYELVKARHRAADPIDLLLRLRNLLRDHREARGAFQQRFDHIFVDELQDTDPLQAEVVLFLCEREPLAARAEDVVLADGKLTVVGDPKQSIYRFRRADVAMYDRVRALLMDAGARCCELQASFRAAPGLIDWVNDRFAGVLGRSPDGVKRFDAPSGAVYHMDLYHGAPGAAAGCVHVLPFEVAGATTVDRYRAMEARVLARYLRWLVERSDVTIRDEQTGAPRRPGWGDVAVLAISTTSVPLLFPELDALGIPHAARGGRLFLDDALHRQFLLGLRAIADAQDGVAQAALLRPPFYDVDLTDLAGDSSRAQAVDAAVAVLRRDRLARSAGATARDLLERSGFGAAAARGPNGAQRLARLRELCLVVEQTALAESLDFDGVTARLRDWVLHPVPLDPPHPVGSDALQIMTVHQAKGLEFPVVVLWDGRAPWTARADAGAWRMNRDGKGWLMELDGLVWEQGSSGLRDDERRYREAERRRIVYVAATRARDLLVLPRAGAGTDKLIAGALLNGAKPEHVTEMPACREGSPWPAWAADGDPPPSPPLAPPAPDRDARWLAAAQAAARPRANPIAVSAMHEHQQARAHATAPGRGPDFGAAVHRAIGRALAGHPVPADVRADVDRALACLRAEGLLAGTYQLEYPVAALIDGTLVSGYADFVAATPAGLVVIDFKTDPPGPIDPAYQTQVRTYARLLGAARCGLLYTSQGTVLTC